MGVFEMAWRTFSHRLADTAHPARTTTPHGTQKVDKTIKRTFSQQVLRLRGDSADDFEAMVVGAYLRRCSVDAAYTTSITPTEVVHRWTWPRNLVL